MSLLYFAWKCNDFVSNLFLIKLLHSVVTETKRFNEYEISDNPISEFLKWIETKQLNAPDSFTMSLREHKSSVCSLAHWACANTGGRTVQTAVFCWLFCFIDCVSGGAALLPRLPPPSPPSSPLHPSVTRGTIAALQTATSAHVAGRNVRADKTHLSGAMRRDERE